MLIRIHVFQNTNIPKYEWISMMFRRDSLIEWN